MDRLDLGQPHTFWGKLQRDATGQLVAWHPLVDHSIDVASCAEALLLQPTIRGRLARLGGLPDLDEVHVARLSLLAGLHDIGKYNHGFQRRATSATLVPIGHVEPALNQLVFEEETGTMAGGRLLAAIGLDELEAWGPGLTLLKASICHHGGAQPESSSPAPALWEPLAGRDPFLGIHQLRLALGTMFPLATHQAQRLPTARPFEHAFAGLVMLADWLGSDRRAFPYSTAGETDRPSFARAQAQTLMRQIGLDPSRARGHLSRVSLNFQSITGRGAPRPAQQALRDLPLEKQEGSIAILEAETGSGKTEAAFLRFVDLFKVGMVDGLYFALPTRTAATEIFGRIRELLKCTFEEDAPPVLLAVPGYLRLDDQEGQRALSGFEVLWPDRPEDAERFRTWAVENSKRYLAGSVCVGTIDQVLLSALATRHSHLRATALLRHLLVVDEVHASDAYMNRVLEDVLRRHVRAGGHALLLSATLTGSSRTRLLQVASGRRMPRSTREQDESSPYPLISVSSPSTTSFIEVVGGSGEKIVEPECLPISAQVEDIARRALSAARKGARVLVIRNTVKDCLSTQRALEALAGRTGDTHLLFSCQGVVCPHHSRYAPEDRSELDRALLERFARRTAVVVVATQTVQQSLDLDADYLMTDLCPIDVLLQRCGRLHRRQVADRPPGFAQARLGILTPTERNLELMIRRDGSASGPHGLGTVYEDLRMLEATWRLVETGSRWSIPSDNRRLVEGGLHPVVLTLIAGISSMWTLHANKVTGELQARRQLGSFNCVDWDMPYARSVFDAEAQVGSRLGDADRQIILPRPLRSPFNQLIKTLKVPSRMAVGLTEAGLKAPLVLELNSDLTLQIDGKTLVYSRLGLERGA